MEDDGPKLQAQRPIPDNLTDMFADLSADSARVVELLREWDDDENGTTDRHEFKIALPVLELEATHEEVEYAFNWLLAESHRRMHNAHEQFAFEKEKYEKALVNGEFGVADGVPPPGEEPPAPPAEGDVLFSSIEHWDLFRILAGLNDEDADDPEDEEPSGSTRRTEEVACDGGGGDRGARARASGRQEGSHEPRERRRAAGSWAGTCSSSDERGASRAAAGLGTARALGTA